MQIKNAIQNHNLHGFNLLRLLTYTRLIYSHNELIQDKTLIRLVLNLF